MAQEHRALNRLIVASDERPRRLLARQHGQGGVTLLARVTGLDRDTVAGGRRELGQPFRLSERIFRPGAGPVRRKKVPRS